MLDELKVKFKPNIRIMAIIDFTLTPPEEVVKIYFEKRGYNMIKLDANTPVSYPKVIPDKLRKFFNKLEHRGRPDFIVISKKDTRKFFFVEVKTKLNGYVGTFGKGQLDWMISYPSFLVLVIFVDMRKTANPLRKQVQDKIIHLFNRHHLLNIDYIDCRVNNEIHYGKEKCEWEMDHRKRHRLKRMCENFITFLIENQFIVKFSEDRNEYIRAEDWKKKLKEWQDRQKKEAI